MEVGTMCIDVSAYDALHNEITDLTLMVEQKNLLIKSFLSAYDNANDRFDLETYMNQLIKTHFPDHVKKEKE